MNLRKLAKGQNCKIRIPGICSHNPDTVVLCHINDKRLAGSGMGGKVPDLLGAHGCSACHDAIDGRAMPRGLELNGSEILLMFYEGVFRTQAWLLKEGLV